MDRIRAFQERIKDKVGVASEQEVNSAEMENEKASLVRKLQDAVKEVQRRYHGKQEIATATDSAVTCLCQQFEAVFMHGLKPPKKRDGEHSFWSVVSTILTNEDATAISYLQHITTDSGRGRAWIRWAINERSLGRYLEALPDACAVVSQYYNEFAYIRDEDKLAMFSGLAIGLESIVFAIDVDTPNLNSVNHYHQPVTSGEASRQNSEVTYSETPAAKFNPMGAGADTPAVSLSVNLPNGDGDSFGGDIPDGTASPPHQKKKKKKKKGKKDTPSIGTWGDDHNDLDHEINSIMAAGPKSHSRSKSDTHAFNAVGVDGFGRGDSLDGDIPRVNDEMSSSYPDLADQPGATSAATSRRGSMAMGDYEGSTQKGPYDDEMMMSASVPASTGGSPQSTDGTQYQSTYQSLRDTGSADYGDASQASRPSMVSSGSNYGTDHDADATSSYGGMQGGANSDEGARAAWSTAGTDAGNNGLMDASSTSHVDGTGSAGWGGHEASGGGGSGPPSPATIAKRALERSRQSSAHRAAALSSNAAIPHNDTAFAPDDLRQVLVGVMRNKDALEDEVRDLEAKLDSSKHQMEELQRANTDLQTLLSDLEKEANTTGEHKLVAHTALSKENALLKQQLKKYVAENQQLKRASRDLMEGRQPGSAIFDDAAVFEDEAVSDGRETDESFGDYASIEDMQAHHEQQILQLSQMHCEVLELNERLQDQLRQRDQQVEVLGGIVPADSGRPALSRAPIPDAKPARLPAPTENLPIPGRNTVVNIWIPAALLRGKGSESYHVYQICCRVGEDEWNVYRRYTHFADLHRQVHGIFPGQKITLPRKKALNRKGSKFVEERRMQLEQYIRLVVKLCISQPRSPMAMNPCKQTFCEALPFLREKLSGAAASRAQDTTYGGL
eukprot:m.180503 g.180503  ORF g.180503 m.180503 type:complete len:898 (+) comp18421_c0_seq2:191-2884(+)